MISTMSLHDPINRRARPTAQLSMMLLRLTGAVKRLTLVDSQSVGLTPVQAQTLLFVRDTKSFATSIGQLAATLGTSHPTAVGVVAGLVTRGLIVKTTAEDDRRVTLLRLTSTGQALCDRLDDWAGRIEASLAGLGAPERAALDYGLGALVDALRDAGVLSVAEACHGCRFFQPNQRRGASEPHHCALIDRFFDQAEADRDCPDFSPHVG